MSSIYQRCLGATALVALSASSASAGIWSDMSRAERSPMQTTQIFDTAEHDHHVPAILRARQLRVDLPALSATLDRAPLRRAYSTELSGTVLELPMPNGETARFSITNAPIFAGQNPSNSTMRTFRAVDVDNPLNTGRLDLTPKGFHAMVNVGEEVVFIDPLAGGGYQSYYKSDYMTAMSGQALPEFTCDTPAHNAALATRSGKDNMTPVSAAQKTQAARAFTIGTQLKTYTIAVAATGEYTAFHGGTKEDAQAAIVTAFNRLNQVFERDVATTMVIAENNIDAVFTDAATDPFTDDSPRDLIEEVGPVLDEAIGNANYDLGHVFSTQGGGLAALGSVCGTFKAQGVTGIRRPIGDAFLIDFVAHELGHQFGAVHTFNSEEEGCGGGNRSSIGAYEPGSGSTIMGYAQLCGEEDLQFGSDDFFHTFSITQMRDIIENASRGGSCGTSSDLDNVAPVVSAGIGGVIPISTPFSLTGTATDADGDTLSYVWEQYDLGPATDADPNTRFQTPLTEATDGPLFRSIDLVDTGTRIFPKLSDILTGTATKGERLPTTTRELNFRLTVRDGKGGVTAGQRALDVVAGAGPFTVEDLDTAIVAGNAIENVSWDVANTTAAPVSCATVDIDLSKDGGLTFPFPLLDGTVNDGNADVTIPAGDAQNARLRVSCATQPFFAINPTNFRILGNAPPPVTNTAPVATNDSFTIDANSVENAFSVLGNDSDADGDDLTITGVSNFSDTEASAEIDGDTILFTPAADAEGEVRFDYTVSDGEGGTDTATVTVTITPPAPNRTPTATNDAFTLEFAEIGRFDVLDNDNDPDDDTLTITGVENFSGNGSATIEGTTIVYDPDPAFEGVETFDYTISDGRGGTATATVTVTVEGEPDTPPVANDDRFTVNQNSAASTFDVLANDTDADVGDVLDIQSVGTTSNGGTVSVSSNQIRYTPATGYSGTETFTYTIGDTTGNTASATVTVTVRATTPPPVVTPPSTGGGGGGGSFGLLLLGLLGLRRRFGRNTDEAGELA